jgi:hypothetical protein
MSSAKIKQFVEFGAEKTDKLFTWLLFFTDLFTYLFICWT